MSRCWWRGARVLSLGSGKLHVLPVGRTTFLDDTGDSSTLDQLKKLQSEIGALKNAQRLRNEKANTELGLKLDRLSPITKGSYGDEMPFDVGYVDNTTPQPGASSGTGLSLSSRTGFNLQSSGQGLYTNGGPLDNFGRGFSGSNSWSVLEGDQPISYTIGSGLRSGLGLFVGEEDFHQAGQAWQRGEYGSASMYALRGTGAAGLTVATAGQFALAKAGMSGVVGGTGLRASAASGGVAHPLAGMAPTDVINSVQQLGLQTGRDELLLWSGLGRGREGIIRSQEYAAQNGGRTLEMTPGGKWLDSMDLYGAHSPFTRSEADHIWGSVSKSLVEQASGQVRALQGQVRPTSVFRQIELPALQANPNILGLDPVRLKPAYQFGRN